MTRREFDKQTKWNHHEPMPGDTRVDYRQRRHLEPKGARAPLLERRAEYLERRGMSPLWIGSPLRAPALYRARVIRDATGRARRFAVERHCDLMRQGFMKGGR